MAQQCDLKIARRAFMVVGWLLHHFHPKVKANDLTGESISFSLSPAQLSERTLTLK